MDSLQKKQDKNGKKARKPYIAPQVQIYGDLREITQTVAKKGNDGGMVMDFDGTHN